MRHKNICSRHKDIDRRIEIGDLEVPLSIVSIGKSKGKEEP